MDYKRFKDPVYGYIEIEENIVARVLDTATFQRLRDIIQTSYSPLYSSALHNRFSHSLGVYHLGKIAAQTFLKHFPKGLSVLPSDFKPYIQVFTLACLLHDVGHAPFSHTGEQFFLKGAKHERLHADILDLVEDPHLETEIENNFYKAAPHELMSVIVGLRNYKSIIKKSMRSFFARCITGYKYTEDLDEEKELLNCLIELLNSSVIDVDKLDYLIRDSYMSGFDTVKIDYIRLLESIRVQKIEKHHCVCYYKTAVSVIENVVYAHDAERKWIQNHPTVLYEIHLLENLISQVIETFMDSSYLDYVYLTQRGKRVKGLGKLRLMGDGDMTFLIKNLPNKGLVKEYFDRHLRRHPIWKTEAEYQAIFGGNEGAAEIIEAEFAELLSMSRGLGYSGIINETVLDACREDMQRLEDSLSDGTSEKPDMYEINVKKRKHQIEIMEALQKFSLQENIKFEFLIISGKQFNSGFRKPEFSKIQMVFPELKHPCAFNEVSNALKADASTGENFFYLYYTRKKSRQKLHIADIISDLLEIAYGIGAEKQAKEVKSRLK